jgi:hypothetical protein
MTEDNFTIKSIYYTKPRLIHNSNGEPIASRYGVIVIKGQRMEIFSSQVGMRIVENIAFDEDTKAFEITFKAETKIYPNPGLLVVPLQPDTEVYYEKQ